MSCAGTGGVSLLVVSEHGGPPAVTPFTVLSGTTRTWTVPAGENDGGYAFSVYGPDRFVRVFAGQVAGPGAAAVPRVTAELGEPGRGSGRPLRFTLHSDGPAAVAYTLTAHDYEGGTQTVTVAAGGPVTVGWPASDDGYYDVIVTADTADGFTRRYAGRAQR